jgi:hypothetical protein
VLGTDYGKGESDSNCLISTMAAVVCIGKKSRRFFAISLLFALLIACCVRVDSSNEGGDDESAYPNRFDDANRIQSIENLASAVRSSSLHDGKRRTAQDVSSSTDRKRRTRRKKRRNMKEAPSSYSQIERDLIVGGSNAPIGRFPYLVSLQLEEAIDQQNGDDELNNVHTCGATLVAMDMVLTAAHCGYREEKGNANAGGKPKQLFYGADVGAYNLQNGFTGSSNNEVDNLLFETLVVHPNYTGFHDVAGDGYRLQHDLMLVKLYGESDKPVVRLHNPNTDPEPTPDEELSVLGWGDTDPALGEPELPTILQTASVNYIPNDICEKINGFAATEGSDEPVYFNYEGRVSSDMMCAINGDGQDACEGDSGGGLIRLNNASNGESDMQLGIVSWGVTCGDSNFAGVYCRISEHYEWIRDNICELSDKPPEYMNCPLKPYPPGSIDSAPVEITITIKFDKYRGETSWLLETIPDFRNVAFRPFGTYSTISSVDEDNSISETLRVQSGRFYLLTLMDEYADGFCCDPESGDGFFHVHVNGESQPIVPPTKGILWSKHALRRAFYVREPNSVDQPTFITIVLTLGYGANPDDFLYLAVENIEYEVLMLYEIQPLFTTVQSSRFGESGSVYSQVYKVPVFDADFGMQQYNVISYDDNVGAPKASFSVYLGDKQPDNLLLAQSGNYGNNRNNVVRSFVLFKSNDHPPSTSTSLPFNPNAEQLDVDNAAPSSMSIHVRDVILSVSCLLMTYMH